MPCAKYSIRAHLTDPLQIYYLAGGIGSAIGGGIWTNYVPSHLLEYTGNQTLANELFSNPIGAIRKYPVGTPPRDALNRAQGEAQVSDLSRGDPKNAC